MVSILLKPMMVDFACLVCCLPLELVTVGVLLGFSWTHRLRTWKKPKKQSMVYCHGLHEQNEYYKTAMLRADSFALQESDPNMRIDVQILNQQESEYENDKYALESIVECMYTVLWKTRNCITWASRRCYCRL